MDLAPRDLQYRLSGEVFDGPAVAFDERLCGFPRTGAVVTGLLARYNNAGRHTLDVPLPWSANGFIEVIHVKNQLSIRSGEGSQVPYMRIATQLDMDTRVG